MKALGREAALFLGLTLAATWPLALHFGSHAPGLETWAGQPLYFETPVNLWNLWWFRHAVVELRQSPFECPLIFHPYGANLWSHTLAPLHGLLSLPLQPVLGLVAAQNVLLVLNLVLAALATTALARAFGIATAGARLAGAAFAFAPVAFAHLYAGHFELVSAAWFPLALLLFSRLVATPGWRVGVALGLALGLSAWVSPYAFVYSAELLLVVALFRFKALLRPEALRAAGIAVAVAALGVAPIAWHFLTAFRDRPASNPDFTWLSVDLASFFVPSFTHPLLGPQLQGVYARLQPGPLELPQEHTAFVGFSVLTLSVLGWRRARDGAVPVRLLAGLALVFGVLSLGAEFRAFGFATGIPLPAGLLDHVPILRLARAPGRHAYLVMLALALLAGAGFDRLRHRGARWAAALLLAFEFAAAPLPLFSGRPGPVYARLAEVRREFAVLELPLQVRDGQRMLGERNTTEALGQTLHGHPTVGGMASRLSTPTLRALLSAPLVGTLLNRTGVTHQANRRDRREARGWFAQHRVEAIVVHPPEVGGARQRYLESVLTVASREGFPDGSVLLWIDRGGVTNPPP